MQPNPLLKKLGFADQDRLVILHMDDVGMCHASLTACEDLMSAGIVSSAAVMVPCPWFPAVAAYVRAHPGVDMGVHLTLTSEWPEYRWSPLSTVDASSGMIDADGYFHRSQGPVQQAGHIGAVRAELLAQIHRALAAGMDITHIDSHMGTVFHHKFLPLYVEAARLNRLPAFLMRLTEEEVQTQLDGHTARVWAGLVQQLEAEGYPMVDWMDDMPLGEAFGYEERLALARQKLDALPAGITHFILHAAHDTPELRAIAPDWRARVGDWQVFSSPALRDFLRQQGIHIIGYRALREAIPGNA
jgi:hypothetical protein